MLAVSLTIYREVEMAMAHLAVAVEFVTLSSEVIIYDLKAF